MKRKRENLTKCVTDSAKLSIAEAANFKGDNKIIGLVKSYCLVAAEAHYHNSCRKDYTKKDDRQKSITCQST